MLISQHQKNLCFKILEKTNPELHSSLLTEAKKACSDKSLSLVAEMKRIVDEAGITDRRLFVALVIKLFHPLLYNSDNKYIPLQRGLNQAIAEQLLMPKTNASDLIKQVRVWLKSDFNDLKTNTDTFFETCIKYVPGVFEENIYKD